MQTPTEFPLAWPPGVARTNKPGRSAFRTGLGGARENVFASLRAFASDTGHKVDGVILSSNVSGLSGRRPDDTGVAVWFIWDGEYRCVAVDRYDKVECNLQAIHHVLEAERTKMRHGGLNIVRATFRAYMALPGPGARRGWREVLGSPSNGTFTREWVQSTWKRLAAFHHPDKGGDPETMAEINAARDAALKELQG